MKTSAIFTVICLVLLPLRFVFSASAEPQVYSPSIGVIVPLTGNAAEYGVAFRRGIEMASRDRGKDAANHTHREVGAKVRRTIQELGGTMPEDLPAAESVKKIVTKQRKRLDEEREGEDKDE